MNRFLLITCLLDKNHSQNPNITPGPVFGGQVIFTDENGNRFKDIKKSFKSALRRAGIKDFTFHDLRHTFASHLVMSGADIVTVKELLGHKTLKMTLRYAHLSPGHKAKAVERLAEKLSSGSTIQKTIQSALITKKGVSE